MTSTMENMADRLYNIAQRGDKEEFYQQFEATISFFEGVNTTPPPLNPVMWLPPYGYRYG